MKALPESLGASSSWLGDVEPGRNSATVTSKDVKEEPGIFVLICFHILSFWAYWFGADQFDYDGDGDFDYEDVDVLLFGRSRVLTKSRVKKVKTTDVLHTPKTPREPPRFHTKGFQWNPDADIDGQLAEERVVVLMQNNGFGRKEAMIKVMLEHPAYFRKPVDVLVATDISDDSTLVPGALASPDSAGTGGPSLRDAGQPSEDDDGILDWAEASVEGSVSWEKAAFNHKPVFICVWSGVVFLLWLFTAPGECDGSVGGPNGFCFDGWSNAKAGLDSIWPRKTDLRMTKFDNCADFRAEVYRWITYQFTHVGLSHVGMNVFLNLIVGIPLNGFHGNLRMFLMFNIGVFGGACAWMTSDVLNTTVGMSGGCWALIGMMLADLLMNWAQKKYRYPHLAMLVFLGMIETLNYYFGHSDRSKPSNSAHFGGFLAGLFSAIVVGRNIQLKNIEKLLMVVAFVVGMIFMLFALTWTITQWPPRTIFQSMRGETPWCWIRQVVDPAIFGDVKYHCIRCGQQACMDAWLNMTYVHTATKHACETDGGGFAFTDEWPPFSS